MVVTKPEFQNALHEINESYAKLSARIEKLEQEQDKAEKAPAKATTRKSA